MNKKSTIKIIRDNIARKLIKLLRYVLAFNLFLATSLIIKVSYPRSKKIENNATKVTTNEYLPNRTSPKKRAIYTDNIIESIAETKLPAVNENIFFPIF